jgi:hypothetical protein
MKNSLYVLVIVSLFLSCRSDSKRDDNSGVDKLTQQLIKQFSPVIQGVWVRKKYIDKVTKTKSPFAAEDEAIGMTVKYINTSHIKGDSLTVSNGMGNHEGGQFVLKFHQGKKYKSTLTINNDLFSDVHGELGYSIKKNDTTLVLYSYNDEKKSWSTIQYVKALNTQADDDIGYGLNFLINKRVFSDKYTCIDSTGMQSNVTLTNDGKIIGLPCFKTYYIQNDLGSEPMSNLDEINFDLMSKNQKGYTFKFDKDTLKLYDIKANSDSTLELVGSLKYKLVKQK